MRPRVSFPKDRLSMYNDYQFPAQTYRYNENTPASYTIYFNKKRGPAHIGCNGCGVLQAGVGTFYLLSRLEKLSNWASGWFTYITITISCAHIGVLWVVINFI